MNGSSTIPISFPCVVPSLDNHTSEIHSLSIQFDPAHHFNDSLVCSYSHYTGSTLGSVSGSYSLNTPDTGIALFDNSPGIHYKITEAFDNTLYYVNENGGIVGQRSREVVPGGETVETVDFTIAHTLKQPGQYGVWEWDVCMWIEVFL